MNPCGIYSLTLELDKFSVSELTLRLTAVKFWRTQHAVADRRESRLPVVGQVLRRPRRRANDHCEEEVRVKQLGEVFKIFPDRMRSEFSNIYCCSATRGLRLSPVLRGARVTEARSSSTSCSYPGVGCAPKYNSRGANASEFSTAGSTCGDCDNGNRRRST